METTFQDKLLICSECGNQFVYTVGQQRMAYEEAGVVTDPDFCPVCSVKVERMGRRPAEPAPVAYTNGVALLNGRNGLQHHHHSHDLTAQPYEGQSAATAPTTESSLPENYDAPVAPYQSEQPKPPSPNRPADYRSGNEHPLAGHGGETFAGVVKWFNDRKGFGFVTLDNGVEVFVHYSGIVSQGYKTLKQNQRVQITVEDTDKGPQAGQVTVLPDDPAQPGSDLTDEQPNELV